MNLQPYIHIRPATLEDSPALGRLWWLCFSETFGPALGSDEKRNIALLSDLHRIGRGRIARATLAAEAKGEVAGFLLHHTGEDTSFPIAEGWRTFRRYLGTGGTLRALLTLSLIELGHSRPPRGEAVIELVGVDPEWRGRGIGRRLVQSAIAIARAARRKAVSLEVVWGNTRARRLYESLGFDSVLEKRSRLLQWISGPRGWTRMVLPL